MKAELREDVDSLSLSSSAMAAAVDSRFPSPSSVSSDELVQTLRANKFSHELAVEAGVSELNLENDAHREHRRAREKRLNQVTAALNDRNVSYASIKNLRGPKVLMSDIDLLIPDPAQQAKAARVLAERDYEFYRFRLLAHPRKMMAKQSEKDPRPVDIYPDAIWIRKRVCNPIMVVDRAADDGERTPAPEDDLYLVATHAFSHFSVTFAEMFHGVCLIEDNYIDWDYLTETAVKYGCADSLYTYLRLVDAYLAVTDRDRVPDDVLEKLGRAWPCRLVDRWWCRQSSLDYPVDLPVFLAGIVSSFYHTPRIARHSSLRETFKDVQSHYLATASQLLLGEA